MRPESTKHSYTTGELNIFFKILDLPFSKMYHKMYYIFKTLYESMSNTFLNLLGRKYFYEVSNN